MATTVIKSIKPAGGGDYTSLNGWAADRMGDITVGGSDTVEIAEVYSGGNAATGKLTISTYGTDGTDGWITDSTHYIEIRAASGEAHAGVWDTNEAYASVAENIALLLESVIQDVELHVNIVGMQMETTTTSAVIRAIDIYAGTNTGAKIVCTMDKCIFRYTNTRTTYSTAFTCSCLQTYGSGDSNVSTDLVVKNSVLIASLPNSINRTGIGSQNFTIMTLYSTVQAGSTVVYNSDLIVRTNGKTGAAGSLLARAAHTVDVVTSTQNCYLAFVGTATSQLCYSGFTGGSNDATVNGEASDPGLQNVTYDTTNFTDVTGGSENLLIKTGSVLKNAGVDLSGSGVTYDIRGVARPQGAAFDIGGFELEDGPPICWNYTARFKGSKKLFKASGGGCFPRNLRVPGNVDRSTGRMIDDGKEIDPDHYEVF